MSMRLGIHLELNDGSWEENKVFEASDRSTPPPPLEAHHALGVGVIHIRYVFDRDWEAT
jgi:hypothetical protein